MTDVIGDCISQTMRELMHLAIQRGGVVEIRENQVGEVIERHYRLSTCNCVTSSKPESLEAKTKAAD